MSLVFLEVRRGLARRSTRVLVTLAVALIVTVAVGVFVNSRAEASSVASRAEAARDRQQYVDDCVGSGGFGGEVEARSAAELRQACDLSAAPVSEYEADKRFKLTSLWPGGSDGGVLGVTALFLVIGALIAGATFIGGDWRYGTVATLLTWEPRRLRIFLSKAAAVAVASLVIGILLQSLVSASLLPSAWWRGTTEGADAEWFRGLAGATLRTSALGAGAALLGYAIAMLGRNTAAALGVAFGYVAVVEALVRGVKPQWQRWLIGDNSTVVLFGEQVDSAPFERTLLEASVILVVYLVAVLAVAGVSFTRRDVAT